MNRQEECRNAEGTCAHAHRHRAQAFRLLISINGVCIAPQYASALQDRFLLEQHRAIALMQMPA